MEYYLSIHIGPMQAFIAAARRTRDLWFGSWLMSELSKAAARKVAEIAGEDTLIFPAASLSELQPLSDLSVANKIVAIVENPDNVATEAEEALRKRLDTLCAVALNEVHGALDTRQIAIDQIRDLPEFYWVAVPLASENDYVPVRQMAENLLAARKNLREFKQPTWSSGRPKSSLDGNRESVIPESAYPTHDDPQKEREEKIEALYKNYRARGAERLSGVDLLKRLGKREEKGEQERFPSTSHMAAMQLANQLAAKVTPEVWNNYWSKLPKTVQKEERVYSRLKLPNLGDADGSLLFASRLLDYFDKPGNSKDGHSSGFAEAQQALDEFYKTTKLDRPNPYYALLIGDGDFMGRTINCLNTPEAHRQFSQTLSRFAREARKTVEKFQGAPVYTGGDDVMALLPVHLAIQCAAELAKQFRETMSGFSDDEGRSPTFSAGIAIFHHIEPLEDALQTARDAEKVAKSVSGKNALAVTEAKRSGAPRTVKGRWGELDAELLHLAGFYQETHQDLPMGLAYQLRDAYLRLGGDDAVKKNPNLRDVLAKEAGRLVKRKEGTDAARRYIEAHLVGRLSGTHTMEQIANELIIAVTLAQAADRANMTLPLLKESENGTMDH